MTAPDGQPIEAVIFDLDGLLIDSEQVWDDVRREYVAQHGGHWHDGAQRDMMGMSAPEWSRYVHEQLAVPLPPARINAEVAGGVAASYRSHLPWLPGAREAVRRIAANWPLGLASSSNREVIDLVLEAGGLARDFRVTVSSEEVGRGKPAPDVYLAAARGLGADPAACAAVEDSHNGILSAVSAGMRVIAVPNAAFPPGEEALAAADVTLPSLDALTAEVVGSRG